jgi:hypothetical protein
MGFVRALSVELPPHFRSSWHHDRRPLSPSSLTLPRYLLTLYASIPDVRRLAVLLLSPSSVLITKRPHISRASLPFQSRARKLSPALRVAEFISIVSLFTPTGLHVHQTAQRDIKPPPGPVGLELFLRRHFIPSLYALRRAWIAIHNPCVSPQPASLDPAYFLIAYY